MPESMRMKTKVLWTSLALLLSVPVASQAKCPFAEYRFTGRLMLPREVEHDAVRVVLFLDDLPYSSAYPPEEGEEDFGLVDEEGLFHLSVHFNTASRRRSCNNVATEATLVILGKGFRTVRKAIELPKNRRILKALEAEIELGIIKLDCL